MCIFFSQGELLWQSSVQSPLTEIVTDEQREVVITADSTGLIKTWQGQTGQEMASFSTASPHCSLLQYNVNNSWFLTVSDWILKSLNAVFFSSSKLSVIMKRVIDEFILRKKESVMLILLQNFSHRTLTPLVQRPWSMLITSL